MRRTGTAVTIAAAAYFLVRLALSADVGAWGVNSFRYMTGAQVLVWAAFFFILLLPPIYRRVYEKTWDRESTPWPAWAVATVFLVFAWIMPFVGVPILGDGMDRLDATLAGWKGMQGQPAPLDILIHVALYKLGIFADPSAMMPSQRTWRVVSNLSGCFAVAAVWKLASARANTAGGRSFLFFSILFAGTVLFFFGYVENYVTLAAALYWYLVLLQAVPRKKYLVWTIPFALAGLVGLHYFMVLLVVPTFYALYRHGLWKPDKKFLVATAAVLAAFGAFVLGVVQKHYGGVFSIFVAPADLFGRYHLIGFLNQQLLACPALPVLLVMLAFVFAGRNGDAEEPDDNPSFDSDPVLSFTGLSSIIMIVFFFFIHPVIGEVSDWDLFAIPSLFFTPWMVLLAHKRLGKSPEFPRAAWAVILITLASVGPWLAISTSGITLMERFEELMRWEAQYNRSAASFGLLRYGRYLSRDPFHNREQKVEDVLLQAVEWNPDSANLRIEVAKALTLTGREELAKLEMAAHHRLKAARAEQAENYEEAATQYETALTFEPEDEISLKALVRLYQTQLKDPAKAQKYWRLAEQLGRNKSPDKNEEGKKQPEDR